MMNTPSSITAPLWPFAVYFLAVLILVSIILVLSYVLGQRHTERSTGEPYESGIVSAGSARVRFDARFYMVAMLFVIFDLEAMYIFAWAVSLREVGWTGYAEMLVFVAILVSALVYLWRLGALDWGTTRRKRVKTREQRTGRALPVGQKD